MENAEKVSLKNEILGCLISLLTVLCFTLGSVAVQALNGFIPDFELNAIRLTGMLLLVRQINEIICMSWKCASYQALKPNAKKSLTIYRGWFSAV